MDIAGCNFLQVVLEYEMLLVKRLLFTKIRMIIGLNQLGVKGNA